MFIFCISVGYLYIGDLNARNSIGDADGSPVLSSDSAAIVRAMQTAGESVQVTRNVQTLLDSSELQVLHTSRACCSAECQTDFEPMWSFGSGPIALTSGESGELISQLSGSSSSHGLIDMRNCEQFTVARLEDMRDPSAQSFVMVQTSGLTVSGAGSADNQQRDALCDADATGCEPSSPSLERIGSSPAMFVGHDTHWKREQELSRVGVRGRNVELSQHPADIDSGIWDMVQALGAGGDSSGHVNLFNSVGDGNDSDEIHPGSSMQITDKSESGLKGTYRVFNMSGGEGGSQPEMVEATRRSSVETSNGGGWRKDHGGSLSDALEPIAVVDFVFHRIEADSDQCDKLKVPEGGQDRLVNSANKGSATGDGEKMNQDQLKMDEDKKPVQSGEVQAKCASRKNVQNEQEVSGSGVNPVKSAPVESDSGQACKQTERLSKSHEKAEKMYKDLVEITSVRLARHSTRRRTGGRYKYWRESHMKSRKTKSADTSPRCSSMIDVGVEPQEPHGLSTDVGSLSLAHSSEHLSQSPERDAHSKTSKQFSKGNSGIQHHHHHHISSPCDSWPNFGRSSRMGSGNLSVSSLDWLADSTVPGLGRAPSAPSLDLYAEPELTDFEKFPNWMRDLPEVLHSVPLSRLCIPGKEFHVLLYDLNASAERPKRTLIMCPGLYNLTM